ncbi:MAG TPA: hypothetical protein PLS50_07445, partial [Candidatus Dojkabacteria bacterium]|nr:hypothetical protein [Candidatus Dojkabacteria bacterium]
ATSFQEVGFEFDILTRYYDDDQREGKSMHIGSQSAKNYTASYFRDGNILYTNFTEDTKERKCFEKLPPVVRGLYAYYKVDLYHYGWLNFVMEAFKKELITKKYDYIFASYGPPVVLLAARKLSRKFNIPWIADFRDIYIDERDTAFQLIAKKLTQEWILNTSSAIVFATDGMKDYFNRNASIKLRNKENAVIYNGVVENSEGVSFNEDDADVVDEFNQLFTKHDIVCLHTGTLYKAQNISFFIDNCTRYNKANSNRVAIVFLGLSENEQLQKINAPFCYFLRKVSHNTSMFLQRLASGLILPIWQNRYTGFSGKTFEYLYSGKWILSGPNPQKDLLKFFKAAGTVLVLANYDDFSKAIEKLLIHKKWTPNPEYNSHLLFKRKYWNEQLINFIKQL